MHPHRRSKIRFTPVRLKARHDGWTAARQRRFIEVLAATKSITKACQAVRMSRMSAYKLRDHPDSHQLRLAWDGALRRDCDRPRTAHPGAAARLRRLRTGRKVDDVQEVETSPKSIAHSQSTSSALTTLETYLSLLRSQDDALGSERGE
jgi:hypothetical protein